MDIHQIWCVLDYRYDTLIEPMSGKWTEET